MEDFKVLRYGRRFTRIKLKRTFYSVLFVWTVLILANITIGNTATYTYKGETYDQVENMEKSRGRIVEFTNADEFCHSWVIIPGTSLQPSWLLAIAYFLALVYLFLGIALVSDIFMD